MNCRKKRRKEKEKGANKEREGRRMKERKNDGKQRSWKKNLAGKEGAGRFLTSKPAQLQPWLWLEI